LNDQESSVGEKLEDKETTGTSVETRHEVDTNIEYQNSSKRERYVRNRVGDRNS